eukprot:Opistho-2@17135
MWPRAVSGVAVLAICVVLCASGVRADVDEIIDGYTDKAHALCVKLSRANIALDMESCEALQFVAMGFLERKARPVLKKSPLWTGDEDDADLKARRAPYDKDLEVAFRAMIKWMFGEERNLWDKNPTQMTREISEAFFTHFAKWLVKIMREEKLGEVTPALVEDWKHVQFSGNAGNARGEL